VTKVAGKRALLIGRFQPFHKGHFSIIQEIIHDVQYLIICIGSSRQSFTPKNPFTCGERMLMIKRSLPEKWQSKIFLTGVDDINRYNVWVSHIEDLVPPFDVVVTNSELTRTLFHRRDYSIYSPDLYSRGQYKGEIIRKMMGVSEEWMNMVPSDTAEVIISVDGPERIKCLINIR